MKNDKNKTILMILLVIIAVALVYIGIILTPHVSKIRVQSNASKKVAIQKILAANNLLNIPIEECKIEDQTYFKIPFSMMDGNNLVYDQNGNFTADCGGDFTDRPDQMQRQALCSQLTQCSVVYSAADSSFDVDVYNVHGNTQQEQNDNSGLQKIISRYPIYPVNKCNYNGNIYYLSTHAIGGGTFLYDENGEQIASAYIGSNGQSGKVFNEEQKYISKSCTTRVYTPSN